MADRDRNEPGDVDLAGAIEAVLLVAGGPVGIRALASATGTRRPEVLAALGRLRGRLLGGTRIQLNAEAAQLVTAPEYADVVRAYLGSEKPPALSRAALETAAAVAYRQPVTRSEIEQVRGVNSDRVLQTLLARGLVEELGRRNTVGSPIEYGTSFAFLEYFGLASLDDLPPISSSDLLPVDAGTLGMRTGREQ